MLFVANNSIGRRNNGLNVLFSNESCAKHVRRPVRKRHALKYCTSTVKQFSKLIVCRTLSGLGRCAGISFMPQDTTINAEVHEWIFILKGWNIFSMTEHYVIRLSVSKTDYHPITLKQIDVDLVHHILMRTFGTMWRGRLPKRIQLQLKNLEYIKEVRTTAISSELFVKSWHNQCQEESVLFW